MPSQVIRAFTYDERSRTLFITFTSGELYAYLDVEPAVHEQLRAAGSRGRYFAHNIRNRYRYRRMDSGGEAAPAPRRPSGPVSPPPAGARRSA